MRTLAILTVALVAPALAACAHADPFEREFRAGNLVEAARVFDRDSSLWHDEDAVFHTAVARATPGSPIYDPEQARAGLQLFLTRFPRSGHRAEVVRLDALLTQLDRLSSQNRSLALRADSLAERLDSVAVRADSAGARAAEQRRTTLQLQADLRRAEQELKSVQEELERLKAIDLRLSRRKRG